MVISRHIFTLTTDIADDDEDEDTEPELHSVLSCSCDPAVHDLLSSMSRHVPTVPGIFPVIRRVKKKH